MIARMRMGLTRTQDQRPLARVSAACNGVFHKVSEAVRRPAVGSSMVRCHLQVHRAVFPKSAIGILFVSAGIGVDVRTHRFFVPVHNHIASLDRHLPEKRDAISASVQLLIKHNLESVI